MTLDELKERRRKINHAIYFFDGIQMGPPFHKKRYFYDIAAHELTVRLLEVDKLITALEEAEDATITTS